MWRIGNGLLNSISAALSLDGTNPRDPQLSRMLGMGMSNAAKANVSHDTVVGLPAVMRAVSIVSNGVSKVPFYVFQEAEDGGRTFDKQHSAWPILSAGPSQEFSMHTLIRTMTAWAMLYGNAVAWFDKRKGYPANSDAEMLPLLPDRTRLVRISREFGRRHDIENYVGRLFVETRFGDEIRTFSYDTVVHIKNFGPNPWWGHDIVETLSETFGGAMAAQEFGNRFYGQGANPAGFVEMPAGMDEESEQRFVESLKRGAEGMSKSHRLMVLEEGAKFHQWTMDPQKAQFLEGKQFDVRQLAMALGIKVHKLIDSANSSFSSLEQANQEHKDDDLMPWLVEWQTELNRKMLSEEERLQASHSIGFDDELMEWSPFGERAKGVVELYNNGVITKDEGRRRVNFGPAGVDAAGRYRIPANIQFEDDMATAVAASAGTEALDELRADYLSRAAKRLSKVATAKASKNDGGKDFLAWADSLSTEDSPAAVRGDVVAMFEGLRQVMQQIAETTPASDLAASVDAAATDWAKQWTQEIER